MYRPGMTKLVFPKNQRVGYQLYMFVHVLFDVLSAAAFDVVTTEPA